MRFRLTQQLAERLRRHQASGGFKDDITDEYDAVLLFGGMGPAMYITMQGQVLADDGGWFGEGPPRDATDDEAIGAIVIGAKNTGILELMDLLPARPDTATTCAQCHGERWMLIGVDVGSGEPGQVICPTCRGRGWSSQQKESPGRG